MMSKREPEYPALPEDVQPPPGSDLKAHALAWASAMGRGLVSAEDAIAAGEALLVLRRLAEPDTATDASD
jgi:hypothetical protein